VNCYPDLKALAMEQLREEILAIEADTYAEMVHSGYLNEKLSPLLHDIFIAGETMADDA
jgi:CPA1 family monovalent cation:H+ antiporter